MVRIIIVILAFLFALAAVFLIDSGERKGAMFFLFAAFFVGIVAGITLCKGHAVDEKSRKLLFW